MRADLNEHTLRDETVQVLVVGTLETKVSAADIIDSLVVDHEGTVRVLQRGVCGEDRVVWLDNRSSSLRGWVDTELQLDFLAKVDRKTLHEESTETRTSSTTEGVEDEETLQSGAVISDVADLVQNLVNQLLANSVMPASIVVGRILLSSDHLLGVEQAAVGTSSDFVDNIGLEIAVDGTGYIFALTYQTDTR